MFAPFAMDWIIWAIIALVLHELMLLTTPEIQAAMEAISNYTQRKL